ncbi:protein translocase subunit SecF [bacterium]|nr:protein translocase subunit SecF [bacterium]
MKIIANRKKFILLGSMFMIVSAVVVGIMGLKLGIDFTGGSLMEVGYESLPTKEMVNDKVDSLDIGGYSLRESGDGYILRTRDLGEEERQLVTEAMTSMDAGGEVKRFTSIGPVIGEELKDKASWAIAGVVLVIIVYIAFAFSGVRKPVGSFVYGGITIFALVHDVLVPTALMAVLGFLYGLEVNVLFVMALLAVLGYSVNDTIVVFDRVRENLVKYRQEKKTKVKNEYGQLEEKVEYIFNQKSFTDIVEESVQQTILRSINTSFTTMVALSALYILGGEVTQTFALILMAGVLAGTYSSIFLATPLLVWWAEDRKPKA